MATLDADPGVGSAGARDDDAAAATTTAAASASASASASSGAFCFLRSALRRIEFHRFLMALSVLRPGARRGVIG